MLVVKLTPGRIMMVNFSCHLVRVRVRVRVRIREPAGITLIRWIEVDRPTYCR